MYLARFGFRMSEILILKWFLSLKIQINSKKTRFWKEKSVENVVILGPMAEATLVCVIFVQRKRIEFPLFSITLPSSTPMQRIQRNNYHTFPATKLKIQYE